MLPRVPTDLSAATRGSRSRPTHPGSCRLRSMNPRQLTLVTVIVAIVVLAVVLVVPRLTSNNAQATGPSGNSTKLDYTGQPVIGAADAPVKLALFEDFLCPHCAEFSDQVWPQIKRTYVDTGKVRVWYFYFPVISQVQSRVIGGLGQCVYLQSDSTFWNLEPIFMRAQQQLVNTAKAIDIATTYAPNLDKQKLQQCVDNDVGAKVVDKDNAIAHGLGLQGTPSVLLDGQLVTDHTWAGVKKAIDAALKKAASGT